jgi:ribosomal protein S18 acetylase RimI-like enzyme
MPTPTVGANEGGAALVWARRQATMGDYRALLALELASWSINFPGEPFSESAFRYSLEAGLRYHRMYVYEHDGQLIGWLWLDFNSSWDAVHIRHVQVAEPFWGRGGGASLLRDAIKESREAGRTAITLNVTKANLRAMHLYRAAGFVLDQDNGDRQRMRLELNTDD